MSFMSAAEIQFVDTNVLIYAYDSNAGKKCARARWLIDSLWQARTGCVSIQVFQEFYSAATGKVRNILDHQTAADIIAELSKWKVHNPDVKDVLSAIQIHQRYNISFWDAMIVNSAAKLGCAVLWSENLNDGQLYEGVKVVNPFSEQAAS
jgi:predicted nucleic acid-binding protein